MNKERERERKMQSQSLSQDEEKKEIIRKYVLPGRRVSPAILHEESFRMTLTYELDNGTSHAVPVAPSHLNMKALPSAKMTKCTVHPYIAEGDWVHVNNMARMGIKIKDACDIPEELMDLTLLGTNKLVIASIGCGEGEDARSIRMRLAECGNVPVAEGSSQSSKTIVTAAAAAAAAAAADDDDDSANHKENAYEMKASKEKNKMKKSDSSNNNTQAASPAALDSLECIKFNKLDLSDSSDEQEGTSVDEISKYAKVEVLKTWEGRLGYNREALPRIFPSQGDSRGFTLRQFFECIEQYEMMSRNNDNLLWFGGVDVNHIFLDRMTLRGHILTLHWGS